LANINFVTTMIIGFPKDCGPNDKVDHEWNSMLMARGGETDFVYYLFTNKEVPVIASNLALQGTAS